ncbi:MAG: lipocalin [Bradymonadales bacterium]|nr:MAG: lipocalin [Bradymonadales bacterium]
MSERRILSALSVFLVTALLMFQSACQRSYRDSSRALKSVSELDLERYSGRWFEAARLPNRFQKDCIKSQARYELRPNEELGVVNQCLREDGSWKSVEGRAWLPDPLKPGQLKLRFSRFPISLFSSNYWVIYIDPDYQAAIVSEPRGRFLWILTREENPDELLIEDLVQMAESKGFDVSPLIFTSEIRIYSKLKSPAFHRR